MNHGPSTSCIHIYLQRGPAAVQVLRRAFGKLQLPGAAIVRWLDEHVQLRLSILLGWLFGRSVFFMQLLRWLGSMARYVRVVAQPAVEVLGEAQPWHRFRV